MTIATTSAAQPAPARFDQSGEGARAGRVLESVRNLDARPGSREPLTPLVSYAWFSPPHYQQAWEWLQAALTLADRHGLTHGSSAWQAVEWLANAIFDLHQKDVDLFHQDRAKQAAALISEQPTPQRREQIPPEVRVNGQRYGLRMFRLSWVAETPAAATNRLSALAVGALPDEWFLATYEHARTDDPIIYARSGAWYIKVAEWA